MPGVATMITERQFFEAISEFLRISDRIGDGWILRQLSEDGSSAFLQLHKKVFLRPCNTLSSMPDGDEGPLRANDANVRSSMDGDYLPPQEFYASAGNVLISMEYNVIYNAAYAVPQLLFNAVKTDGSVLPLQVLHDMIPQTVITRSSSTADQLWETLSQIEHPLLHRPFFALHPCRSAEMIGRIKSFSRRWMVSWLSSVGPAAGLYLSSAYGLAIGQRNDH